MRLISRVDFVRFGAQRPIQSVGSVGTVADTVGAFGFEDNVRFRLGILQIRRKQAVGYYKLDRKILKLIKLMSERLTPLAEPENENFKKKCRKDNFTTTELF